ncbi:MAG: leucyl/phenylalanyl-tRNA--protein transferase [Epsilonproteobacteria bacterium]|nr:leucyl/phenylalanyl-tRNA--protein transferase [Campylobacterota bacterium]NPA57415.1 leucyl/phenylalanyl-tRNA--protein transferase [Campylobacterota bacterium]
MRQILIPKLSPYSHIFPDPRRAGPEGLVAFGGDLHPDRVLKAYREGIFPWYSEGDPILWWSPDPRSLLYPDDIRISRSLRRSLKKFSVTTDRAFGDVIRNCRSIRAGDTWILPEIIEVFEELHRRGFAHSIEVWQEGRLVGGLYGLSLGAAFFGESMFSLVSDASKVALVRLCEIAREEGFAFIDCQVPSDHLRRMGAIEVRRDLFLDQLQEALQKPSLIGRWNFEFTGKGFSP